MELWWWSRLQVPLPKEKTVCRMRRFFARAMWIKWNLLRFERGVLIAISYRLSVNCVLLPASSYQRIFHYGFGRSQAHFSILITHDSHLTGYRTLFTGYLLITAYWIPNTEYCWLHTDHERPRLESRGNSIPGLGARLYAHVVINCKLMTDDWWLTTVAVENTECTER